MKNISQERKTAVRKREDRWGREDIVSELEVLNSSTGPAGSLDVNGSVLRGGEVVLIWAGSLMTACLSGQRSAVEHSGGILFNQR